MLGEVAVDRLIDPRDAVPGDRLLMTKTAGIEGTVILATTTNLVASLTSG